MMNIVLATKRRGGTWRAAFIADGAFHDALINPSLSDLVADALAGVLSVDYGDGVEVAVKVDITVPGEKRGPQPA